jgi:hypothetical protein
MKYPGIRQVEKREKMAFPRIVAHSMDSEGVQCSTVYETAWKTETGRLSTISNSTGFNMGEVIT